MQVERNETTPFEEDLPKISLDELKPNQEMDALSSATEGFLGQRVLPDAVSGASAI